MQRNYLMIGVLLVIAAVSAWDALVNRELPRFHLTVSAIAVVLAIIVAVSRYEFPVREIREQPSGRRSLGWALAIMGSLAAVLWVAFGPWTRSADFDVTGILFLIKNPGQVVALGFFVLVALTGWMLTWPSRT
ncbi:MAG: hypothetical protein WD690_11880 [Vicinamibacterales bacterium]